MRIVVGSLISQIFDWFSVIVVHMPINNVKQQQIKRYINGVAKGGMESLRGDRKIYADLIAINHNQFLHRKVQN